MVVAAPGCVGRLGCSSRARVLTSGRPAGSTPRRSTDSLRSTVGASTALATVISHLCDPLQYAIASLIVIAIAARVRGCAHGAAIAVLLVGANATSQLLKPALAHHREPVLHPVAPQRPRQRGLLPERPCHRAMTLSLALVIIIPRAYRPLVGRSRRDLHPRGSRSRSSPRRHFPSDVVGGYLVATAWAPGHLCGAQYAEREMARGGTIRGAARQAVCRCRRPPRARASRPWCRDRGARSGQSPPADRQLRPATTPPPWLWRCAIAVAATVLLAAVVALSSRRRPRSPLAQTYGRALCWRATSGRWSGKSGAKPARSRHCYRVTPAARATGEHRSLGRRGTGDTRKPGDLPPAESHGSLAEGEANHMKTRYQDPRGPRRRARLCSRRHHGRTGGRQRSTCAWRATRRRSSRASSRPTVHPLTEDASRAAPVRRHKRRRERHAGRDDDRGARHGLSAAGRSRGTATWSQSFQDFIVNRIGPDDRPRKAFWGVSRSTARSPSVGGCQHSVKNGDDVLWVYDEPRQEVPAEAHRPAHGARRHAVPVKVTDEKDGALAGATPWSAARSPTRSGIALLRYRTAGTRRLKARRADSLRSNQLAVKVLPAKKKTVASSLARGARGRGGAGGRRGARAGTRRRGARLSAARAAARRFRDGSARQTTVAAAQTSVKVGREALRRGRRDAARGARPQPRRPRSR